MASAPLAEGAFKYRQLLQTTNDHLQDQRPELAGFVAIFGETVQRHLSTGGRLVSVPTRCPVIFQKIKYGTRVSGDLLLSYFNFFASYLPCT